MHIHGHTFQINGGGPRKDTVLVLPGQQVACDLDVGSRAALYRSYPHIKAEFGQQLAELRSTGQAPDPRDAQIQRLKHQNAELKRRIDYGETMLGELGQFKTLALSRLAAQQEEIQRLRRTAEAATPKATVRQLPARPAVGLIRPR
jgi:hypothetical protein